MTSVVIADDHAFFRAGLESVLNAEGYEVLASLNDGEQAVSAVAEHSPDIVILDVRMPKMNGVEALKALRAKGYSKPVILLAAEFEDDVLSEAMSVRVEGIVNKHGAEVRLLDALAAVRNGGNFFDTDEFERFLAMKSDAGREQKPVADLSEKEFEIAEHVASGLKNREIAQKLGISEAMVKLYLHKIYNRLDIKNRTGLALYMRSRS